MEYTTLSQDRAVDRLTGVSNDIDEVLDALRSIDDRLVKANDWLRENGHEEF